MNISTPDLTPLHDAISLGATHAFTQVPGEELMAIVPPIRRELTELRNGKNDTADLLALINRLDLLVATEEGRQVVSALRRAAYVLGSWVAP